MRLDCASSRAVQPVRHPLHRPHVQHVQHVRRVHQRAHAALQQHRWRNSAVPCTLRYGSMASSSSDVCGLLYGTGHLQQLCKTIRTSFWATGPTGHSRHPATASLLYCGDALVWLLGSAHLVIMTCGPRIWPWPSPPGPHPLACHVRGVMQSGRHASAWRTCLSAVTSAW